MYEFITTHKQEVLYYRNDNYTWSIHSGCQLDNLMLASSLKYQRGIDEEEIFMECL